MGIQLLTGDVGMSVEVIPGGVPYHRQGVGQRMLGRVVADHISAAEVGLPLLEDRTEITEHDVVGLDQPVRRILAIGLQSVRASPDNPLVPVALHSEHVSG